MTESTTTESQPILEAARAAAYGDDGIAEDAAQETLLAYITRDDFRDPVPWARNTATNPVRDRMRLDKGLRRKQRVSWMASLGTPLAAQRMLDEAREATSPSTQVVDRTMLAEALGSFDELSAPVVVLNLIEGRPAAEVAETLDLSLDAVYQRVRRARVQLRQGPCPSIRSQPQRSRMLVWSRQVERLGHIAVTLGRLSYGWLQGKGPTVTHGGRQQQRQHRREQHRGRCGAR